VKPGQVQSPETKLPGSAWRVFWREWVDGLRQVRRERVLSVYGPLSLLFLLLVWIIVLILLRTRHVDSAGGVTYGNLYSDLLDYVVFSVLIFYVLTIAGIFVLRAKRPGAERPYRAFGYPFLPLLYIVAAVAIMFVLLLYKTQTTWPGLVIVLLGVPVYLVWSRRPRTAGGRA